MAQVFKDHMQAWKVTLRLLTLRSFLLFFLPGVFIAVLFLLVNQQLAAVGSYKSYLDYIPYVGKYLEKGAGFLEEILSGMTVFLYQFFVITLLSPFHTLLSEKVETKITSERFPFSWEKIVSDVVRTLGIVILGGLFYLLLKLIWLFVAWVFGLDFLSPYVTFLLISFFTGFNSYDYSLERHDVSVLKSWKFGQKYMSYMLLSGSLFGLIMLLPTIGVVLAPVVLTMSSTVVFIRLKQRKALF